MKKREVCVAAVFHVYLFSGLGRTATAVDVSDEDLYDPASLPEEMIQKKLVVQASVLDILDYHNTTFGDPSADRRFKQLVLGYVTPWNNKGYDRAVKYAKKFTHISPVWLQVVPSNGKTGAKYEVKGTHDIDKGWVQRMKEQNDALKVVPRVLLEGFDGRAFYDLMYDEAKGLSLASAIVKVLQTYGLDGAVLEIWKPVKEDVDRRAMRTMIKIVAEKLKKEELQTILVVPPSGGQNVPGRLWNEDFKVLSDAITAFSVMTYDHPLTYSSGGSIAPLKWVIDSMESVVPEKEKKNRKKLLIGLNHYGYDFAKTKGAEAIVGTTYLEQLQKYHPLLEWDAVGREHVYEYRDAGTEHIVHFPTLKSLELRINLAKKTGSGLAIWELGQGLEYFFDLL